MSCKYSEDFGELRDIAIVVKPASLSFAVKNPTKGTFVLHRIDKKQ
jgi:hypothetical protein